MFKIITVYFVVFLTTFLGVVFFRRWSLRRDLLDIPNERSSHTEPVPRGGGVVICLVSILTFLIFSTVSGEVFYWTYFAGALIVAIISLVDDIKPISPLLRLLFHSLAAGLIVFELGGFERFLLPFYGIVYTGFFGKILAFLWIIWLINAYNFMDGIDGIAAVQAVTAGFGWCLTGYVFGLPSIGFLGGLLAVSSLGFLMLNWQPAKIFMGDVGSAFLGYSFAVIPLLCLKRIESPVVEGIFPWIAVTMVWFFVFDSGVTFIRRLVRGEKVWEAHRQHIYQQLVISGFSHAFITVIYGLASLLVVGALVLALNYSLVFDRTVVSLVIIETILLLLFWKINVTQKD